MQPAVRAPRAARRGAAGCAAGDAGRQSAVRAEQGMRLGPAGLRMASEWPQDGLRMRSGCAWGLLASRGGFALLSSAFTVGPELPLPFCVLFRHTGRSMPAHRSRCRGSAEWVQSGCRGNAEWSQQEVALQSPFEWASHHRHLRNLNSVAPLLLAGSKHARRRYEARLCIAIMVDFGRLWSTTVDYGRLRSTTVDYGRRSPAFWYEGRCVVPSDAKRRTACADTASWEGEIRGRACFWSEAMADAFACALPPWPAALARRARLAAT